MWTMNGERLVKDLSEDGRLVKEFEEKKKKYKAAASQLRTHALDATV